MPSAVVTASAVMSFEALSIGASQPTQELPGISWPLETYNANYYII